MYTKTSTFDFITLRLLTFNFNTLILPYDKNSTYWIGQFGAASYRSI